MKLEMDDNTFYLSLALIAAFVLLAASLGGCHLCEQTKQEAIKAGLIEVPNEGTGTHWTKPSQSRQTQ